ncbi:hypothetical protein E2562_002035 [Oryza meyeriana var. granulata]|uniref:Uncharacterized protein n=1 Tax=Oryza meyeriana var. granulata TaxID=110450 RepID=A0A6G1DQM2_9ORYZ|nr:hypothetical protein E2562_031149 [Oryza meyeriana var. granulata]KAF0922780.1 hypothetical protein E2562_002035 [Oryza meyeriana var. granulata]
MAAQKPPDFSALCRLAERGRHRLQQLAAQRVLGKARVAGQVRQARRERLQLRGDRLPPSREAFRRAQRRRHHPADTREQLIHRLPIAVSGRCRMAP